MDIYENSIKGNSSGGDVDVVSLREKIEKLRISIMDEKNLGSLTNNSNKTDTVSRLKSAFKRSAKLENTKTNTETLQDELTVILKKGGNNNNSVPKNP